MCPKYLTDKEWPMQKIPQQIFVPELVLQRPKKSVYEKLNDEKSNLTGEKSNFCGISRHGMFKSIKYLGHIHYTCPISGMTDKQNRFQRKYKYWDRI
jgi:hypothetical protein